MRYFESPMEDRWMYMQKIMHDMTEISKGNSTDVSIDVSTDGIPY